jgi:hypothetical protein
MPTTTGWEVHEPVPVQDSSDSRFKYAKRHTGFTTEQEARDFIDSNNLVGATICEVIDESTP